MPTLTVIGCATARRMSFIGVGSAAQRAPVDGREHGGTSRSRSKRITTGTSAAVPLSGAPSAPPSPTTSITATPPGR